MSYLDLPRIHFCGRFFTDPSTVNNDPAHYDPSATNPSPWQTPLGQHRFELLDCLITSAYGPNGNSPNDPLVGTPICSVVSKAPTPDHSTQKVAAVPSNAPSNGPAKIVDIDVYQQGISGIYGLNITLNVGALAITGTADTATLNQYWTNCVLPTRSWLPDDYTQDSFGGDLNTCGWFQTVLSVPVANWPSTESEVLNKLKSMTLTRVVKDKSYYLISLKFVLDGFQNTREDKDPLTGRIVGTLGPVFPNEPLYNTGQRVLQPRPFSEKDPWNFPSFNDGFFKVDTKRNVIVFDLSNSICRQHAGEDPVDLGILNAYATSPGVAKVLLGPVDYSAFSYSNNALITELSLTAAQIQTALQSKISLETSYSNIGLQTVLAEPETNIQFAVEVRQLMMEGNVGNTETRTVYITQNGQPLKGKQLNIFLESVHGGMPGVTAGPNSPGNTPQAEGAIEASISESNEQGYATVTVKVLKDPGYRTPELDGQLYFIILSDPDLPKQDYSKVTPPQDQMISCKVFSQYAVNENPDWPEIKAMMDPYMKLYPFMKNRLDLSDLHTFTIFANNPPWVAYGEDNGYVGPLGLSKGAIPYYMSRDITDPRFMPISRDLSANKIMTIMHFCQKLQSTP